MEGFNNHKRAKIKNKIPKLIRFTHVWVMNICINSLSPVTRETKNSPENKKAINSDVIIKVIKENSKIENWKLKNINLSLSISALYCPNNIIHIHRLRKDRNPNNTKLVELNRVSIFCKLSGVPKLKKDFIVILKK